MSKQAKYILVAVTLLMITVLAVFLFHRTTNPNVRAKEMAKLALMASVDNPESLKILSISDADSVFNRNYVTKDEMMSLSVAMMKINASVMKNTNNLEIYDPENKKMNDYLERQMDAISKMRALFPYGNLSSDTNNRPKRFNGWKVKIRYEKPASDKTITRSEYWFILDKDARCVIKSFELPIISKN